MNHELETRDKQMKEVGKAIWTGEHDDRSYLVPGNVNLPDGEYVVRTATGKRMNCNASDLEPYLVTEDQAKAWLKQELRSTLGQLRQSAERHFDKQRATFPDRLLQAYAERTGDIDGENLADLMDAVRGSYQVLPARFKARMHEISERLRQADSDDPSDDT